MAPQASAYGAPNLKMHSAGIYADMTVDGPEIGTLVIVVDRARNLPNLRTMGKQDPYCAARLGKDAKKTDTDMRGGQTPRWDQELRFTVHDSPDYHNLKVSVFNDDKKTDLIGETWIDLDEVLRPGGGQADSWHQLNIRGRYAGEIRIELTFWDSRPKVEKPKKQSNVSAANTQNAPWTAGARQPTGGRPLPTGPAPSSISAAKFPAGPDALPMAAVGPRGHFTPLPQDILDDEPQYSEEYLGGQDFHGQPPSDYSTSFSQPSDLFYDGQAPGGGMAHYNNDPRMGGSKEPEFIYSNDPYALEAVEDSSQMHAEFDYHHQQSTQPRNDRIQIRSGSHPAWPTLPVNPTHTYAAPQLGSQEPYQAPFLEQFLADDFQEEHLGASSTDPYYASTRQYHNQPASTSRAMRVDDSSQASYLPTPPPPPAHRNSVPVVRNPYTQPQTQQTTLPSRPLYGSASIGNVYASNQDPNQQQTHGALRSEHGSLGRQQQIPVRKSLPPPARQHSVDSYMPNYQDPRAVGFPSHLSSSADPMVRPRDELSHDPRQGYGNGPFSTSLRDSSPQKPSPLNPQHPRLTSQFDYSNPTYFGYSEENGAQYHDSPPVVKPRAISPSSRRPVSAFTTPRKSISPQPATEHSSPATPYSPDSFGVFNPVHAEKVSPLSINSQEPTPMYSSPHGPTVRTSPLRPVSREDSPVESPILTSDGRVKDPTDHLPVSSYAPEPERKGADKNRPSTIINIKNRFGPREARPSPPPSSRKSASNSASPLSTPDSRDRLPTRVSGPGLPTTSPLSPAHANVLNSNHPSQNSPYPPPVPAKVPLRNSYQEKFDDYGPGGSMSALAEDMRSIDLDAAPQPRRLRHSRLGP